MFHLTSISCNISIYSYISILSYTHRSPLIFCSSLCTLQWSCTSSSIKVISWNSRFFFVQCTTHNWRYTNITSCRISRGMWVNTSEFTGKDNNKIVSSRFFLLLFYKTLNLCLVFCKFLGKGDGGGLILRVNTYYAAVIVYHLNFPRKSFQRL